MKNVLYHKEKLLNLLGNVEGTHVLEYGCGNGDFIELLLNKTRTKI